MYLKKTILLLTCLSCNIYYSSSQYPTVNLISNLISNLDMIYYVLIFLTLICFISIFIELILRKLSTYIAKLSYITALLIFSLSKSICILSIYSAKFLYNLNIEYLLHKYHCTYFIYYLYHDHFKECIYIISDISAYLVIYQLIKNIFIMLIHKTKIDLFMQITIALLIVKNLIYRQHAIQLITKYSLSLPLITSIINTFIMLSSILLLLHIILVSRAVVSINKLKNNPYYVFIFISCIFTMIYSLPFKSHTILYYINIVPIWITPYIILYIQKSIKYAILKYTLVNYVQNKDGAKFRITKANLIRFALFIQNILYICNLFITCLVGIYIISDRSIVFYIFKTSIILKIIYLIILTCITFSLILFIEYVFTRYAEEGVLKMPFDAQRIETFTNISKTFMKVLIFIISLLILLSICGTNIAPFFQGFGIFSAAISLSIQQFIRDIVNGILILYDRSIQLNDVIEIDGKTSIVEDMSLRYIRVRYDDGTLCTIPFHQINTVKNRNRQYTASILNLAIEINVPIEKTEAAVKEAFSILKDQMEMRRLVRSLELRDITDFTGFTYIMQVKISANQNHHNKVKRAFLRVLKQVFEERDIRIAMPISANIQTVPSASTVSPYTDFE